MEAYFLEKKFGKIKEGLYMLSYENYISYGVFDANLIVRLLSDQHTWRLSASYEDKYDPMDELDLIEFCNKNEFENFIGRLLIEFK